MTRINGTTTCSYQPQVRDFRRPRSFLFGSGTNLFEASFQQRKSTLIRRERGFLALLMFEEGKRGTLSVWAHHQPWIFRVLGQADIEIQELSTALKLTAKFRPVEDEGLADDSIGSEDYVRYLSGLPENRLVLPTARGGVLVASGIPTAGRIDKKGRVWACGASQEALWHFESTAELGAALGGGFLKIMGTPSTDIPFIANQILKLFRIAQQVQDSRLRFFADLRRKYGAMAPLEAVYLEPQLVLVKGDLFPDGKPFRMGDEKAGICSQSDRSDRFRFLGVVSLSSLPKVLRRKLEQAYGEAAGYPVFEDLTHPGFRYFRLA